MLFAVDVQYGERSSVPAAVGFAAWGDSSTRLELVLRAAGTSAPYVPGQFYEREVWFVLDLVARVAESHALDAVVIDGHAWLAGGRPGSGAHLHDALEGRVPALGIAKVAFRDGPAVPVLRGRSKKALFVSAAGIDATTAANLVRGMHGADRIPTLLRRVDQLARGLARVRLLRADAPMSWGLGA